MKFIYPFFLLLLLLVQGVNAQDFQISGGGRFSLAVCANGYLYTWGDNSTGQLGNPIVGASRNVPIKVDFPGNVQILMADGGSGGHAMAIDCNGNLWAWGLNQDGQVGNGQGGRTVQEVKSNTGGGVPVKTPTKVLRGEQTASDGYYLTPNSKDSNGEYLMDVKSISAGNMASYAIVGPKRKLMAWGSNVGIYYSQQGILECQVAGLLGNKNASMHFTNKPVYVVDSTGKPLENVLQVDASDVSAAALTADGKVYSWGLNSNSSLGQGWETQERNSFLCALPVKTAKLIQGFNFEDVGELADIKQITAGDQHYLALAGNGDVYGWGGNWSYQLGVEPASQFKYAVKVRAGQSGVKTGNIQDILTAASFISASQIGSAVVVNGKENGKAHGYLYTFGGVGTYSMVGEPGTDLSGQLGQGHPVSISGDAIKVSVPNLVDTFITSTGTRLRAKDVNVISVSDGDGVFYVVSQNKITLERKVWVMGANNKGQLGLGDNKARNYPTELPAFCDMAEPCPIVYLGPDRKACPGFVDTLRNTSFTGRTYKYNWSFIDTLGNKARLKASGEDSSIVVKEFGKYVLEVVRSFPGGCSSCPVAIDTVQIIYNKADFRGSSTANYCGNYANVSVVKDKPALAVKDNIFIWYPSMTSLFKLGRTKGLDSSNFYLPMSLIPVNPVDSSITLWVADSTIYNGGKLAEKKDLCGLPVSFTNLDNHSIEVTSYGINFLTGFTVSVFNNSESRDLANPDIVKEKKGTLSVDLLSETGHLIITFNAPYSVTTKGIYEVQFKSNVDLSGWSEGAKYLFRIKKNDADTSIKAAFNQCIQGLLRDNLDGKHLMITGVYNSVQNKLFNYGSIYNFTFIERSYYKCGRVPVKVKKICPNIITSLGQHSENAAIAIFPNPVQSTVTINATDFVKATLIDCSGKEINNYYSDTISLENYTSGMYYLKVQTKDKTEILKVVKQ